VVASAAWNCGGVVMARLDAEAVVRLAASLVASILAVKSYSLENTYS
jgi:hypothetical protein